MDAQIEREAVQAGVSCVGRSVESGHSQMLWQLEAVGCSLPTEGNQSGKITPSSKPSTLQTNHAPSAYDMVGNAQLRNCVASQSDSAGLENQRLSIG